MIRQVRFRGFLPTLLILALLIPAVGEAAAKKKRKKSGFEGIPEQTEDPFYKEIETDGLIQAIVDSDADGKADVWIWYDSADKKLRKAIRRQADLNHDGEVDVTSDYVGGKLTKEFVDADFDGKTDWVDHFEGEARVRSDIDADYDGTPDRWKFYEAGVLTRMEEDIDRNGLVDYWEYYKEGVLKKSGRDLDGDGKVDLWGSGEAYLRDRIVSAPQGDIKQP